MRKIIMPAVMALLVLLGASATSFLAGCAALEKIESSTATAALTVQYGTLKYTGDDADKAQRVYDAVQGIKARMTDDSVTLALLDDRVRAQINWERLDMADRLLLDTLLAQVRETLQQRMGTGLLSPDDQVRVLQVMTWVQEAALVAGARSG